MTVTLPKPTYGQAKIVPVYLRTEYQVNPLGIDQLKPLLSWQLRAIEPRACNLFQTDYQIIAASSPKLLELGKADLWDSGPVHSNSQAAISYSGKTLKSGQRVYWKVRAWNEAQRAPAPDLAKVPAKWSQPAWFEMGLLKPEDWQADWISDGIVPAIVPGNGYVPPVVPGNRVVTDNDKWFGDNPAPLLRKEIDLPAKPVRARVYVSGLGYYELRINGKRVGDHCLDPGWTDYRKRTLYSTYDVTSMLKQGKNAIGAMLGGGWFDPLPIKLFGRFDLRDALQTGRMRLLARLDIELSNGQRVVTVTDPSWKWAPGPVVRNSVYLGERYDARKEIVGWDSPGFNEVGWQATVSLGKAWPQRKIPRMSELLVFPLRTQSAPPIRITRTLKPVAVTEPKPGTYIVDMGQNFAGWVRLKVKGNAGDHIHLRYGELLNADGTLNVMTSVTGQLKNRRLPPGSLEPPTAWQEDEYILKGGGTETWQPRFTFHGFRFVELTGFPGKPTLDTLTGLRLNSDVRRVGSFECSNPLLNRILEMCDWTFLSNLFSVQSDCPHREKLGYGGDIVASADAFMYQYDMATFYQKAAEDLADAQRPNGGFTETAPYVGIADEGLGDGAGPVGWGTVPPVLVWNLYQRYGNKRLMEEQWPNIQKWIALLQSKGKDGILDNGISDHESLVPKPRAVTGTAFYYLNTQITSMIARELGHNEDFLAYANQAEAIRKSFLDHYLHPDGTIDFGSQACQAVAIALGLVEGPERERVSSSLLKSIREKGDHVSTGIFGTRYMFESLNQMRRADVAYALATKTDFPSWGHMLERGATTLWEHWQEDDRIYSHNHPMFGSIVQWLYEGVAGLRIRSAGSSDAIFPPNVKSLTWARASYEGLHGRIAVDWRRDEIHFTMTVDIPVNDTAVVLVPAKGIDKVTAKSASGDQLKAVGMDGDYALFDVGSGRWVFTSELP